MKTQKMNPTKKVLSIVIAAMMVLSMSTLALAAGPMQNGAPSGTAQQGNMNQPPQMPQSGEMGQPNDAPQGDMPSAPNSMPGMDDGDTLREDMTPPEDPNATPNENVPAKPKGDVQPEAPTDAPEGAPMDEPIELKGTNLQAVEEYLAQAGDAADANVVAAYTALTEALAMDPDGGDSNAEEDTLESLQTALQEALTNADVDLSSYDVLPEDMPEGAPSDVPSDVPSDMPELPEGEATTEKVANTDNGDDENGEFMQFVSKYWNKLVELFQK